MNRPSTFAVLLLFARTALRRKANISSFFMGKFRRQSPEGGSALRSGTTHRSDKHSLLRRLIAPALVVIMTAGLVLMASMSLAAILESVRLHEASSREVLPIAREDYERLRAATEIADEAERESVVKRMLYDLSLSKSFQQEALQRFEKSGLSGFEPVDPDAAWRGTLAMLSPEGRLKALRAGGLFLLLVNVVFVGMGLGLGRNLAGADPSLVWLFQFPVSRHVLFVSKLVENVFDTSAIVTTGLLSAFLLWGCGCSFAEGLGLAVLFGITAAVGGAALRLASEIWLLQRCGRKTRGAAVGAASTIAGMGMLFVMFCGQAPPIVNIFSAAADFLPGWFFYNPLSLGFGAEASVQGLGAGWWLLAPAMAVLVSAAAVYVAAGLTKWGLACGQDAARDARKIEDKSMHTAGLFRGLAWRELLQIRRQPEKLVMVLMLPLILLFILYINGGGSLSWATHDAKAICTSIFAGSAYLLMSAATLTLASELKTLWFLQCQPRSLADSVRTKARVWGVISILLSLPLLGWAVAVRPADRIDILLQVPFIIAYLWFVAEAMFAVASLGATVRNEQTVRFNKAATFLSYLLVAVGSAAIYGGNLWSQILLLVVLALLSAAMRQKQQAELSWLTEPVETPPKRLYAMHGLLAVLSFLFIRDAAQIGLALAGFSVPQILTIAFCGSALIVGVISWLWTRRTGIAVLPATSAAAPVWRPLLLGLIATCLTGFVWISVLRHFQVLGSAHLNLFSASGGYESWLMAGMIVLVAPLFEEWVFRGLLYQSLRRTWGIAASVALSSLLFTVIHPLESSVAVLVLGIVTAVLVEKTGRLWPSMLVHMGYNGLVLGLWALAM